MDIVKLVHELHAHEQKCSNHIQELMMRVKNLNRSFKSSQQQLDEKAQHIERLESELSEAKKEREGLENQLTANGDRLKMLEESQGQKDQLLLQFATDYVPRKLYDELQEEHRQLEEDQGSMDVLLEELRVALVEKEGELHHLSAELEQAQTALLCAEAQLVMQEQQSSAQDLRVDCETQTEFSDDIQVVMREFQMMKCANNLMHQMARIPFHLSPILILFFVDGTK